MLLVMLNFRRISLTTLLLEVNVILLQSWCFAKVLFCMMLSVQLNNFDELNWKLNRAKFDATKRYKTICIPFFKHCIFMYYKLYFVYILTGIGICIETKTLYIPSLPVFLWWKKRNVLLQWNNFHNLVPSVRRFPDCL